MNAFGWVEGTDPDNQRSGLNSAASSPQKAGSRCIRIGMYVMELFGGIYRGLPSLESGEGNADASIPAQKNLIRSLGKRDE
jgi:hypothetical protein